MSLDLNVMIYSPCLQFTLPPRSTKATKMFFLGQMMMQPKILLKKTDTVTPPWQADTITPPWLSRHTEEAKRPRRRSSLPPRARTSPRLPPEDPAKAPADSATPVPPEDPADSATPVPPEDPAEAPVCTAAPTPSQDPAQTPVKAAPSAMVPFHSTTPSLCRPTMNVSVTVHPVRSQSYPDLADPRPSPESSPDRAPTPSIRADPPPSPDGSTAPTPDQSLHPSPSQTF
ncbi:uncharacterized protein LOC134460564 [Engraulis encrasicolus]|uniref:uncharacterized protein LOC134460564 n=1 Tax=Engraulis encrasicolus TaxID=184585 RepID=UPI002FCF4A28